ncbi:MAG: VOC family protein [Deltaproteobacteria bacterium]|nr:VOC family protein [Deltaproteobacteria bacterium]MCW5801617.1 VOC family protein [Deltaproteobacteria bacterium]
MATTTKIDNTGRFVWFEHVSKDTSKAQGFLGELFGWSTQTVPMPDGPYAMIAAGDKRTIGGYAPTPAGGPAEAMWLAHLCVKSAAESAAKAKSLGATIVQEPTKVGDFGTMAIVKDPFGAVFSLWQPGKPEVIPPTENGTFCWNELISPDPAASTKFYTELGFTGHDEADMGPMGTYYMLKDASGTPRAGIVKNTTPMPPQWTPYVQVASADTTLAKAKKLGGNVVAGPEDIPDVGRFGIVIDTLGAVIGVLQPPSRS